MTCELRVASWNVNGLRSYIVDHLSSTKFKGKTEIAESSNLAHLLELYNPNIICFQETRCGKDNMLKFNIPGWKVYSSSSQGTGGRGPNRYSGVSIWVNETLGLPEPTNILDILPTLSEPLNTNDHEGRFLALEYPDFTIINTYVPNAGTNFTYRTERWDPAILEYLQAERDKSRLTVWVGDLNVARTPYDVHFGDVKLIPQAKQIMAQGEDVDNKLEILRQKVHNNDHMCGIGQNVPAGFTKQERDGIQKILESGYTDAWRYLHPNTQYDGFTWWNLRIPAYRPQNRGWRIDYVIIDNDHLDQLVDCRPLPQVGTKSHEISDPKKYGSDHAPICATIRLNSAI